MIFLAKKIHDSNPCFKTDMCASAGFVIKLTLNDIQITLDAFDNK